MQVASLFCFHLAFTLSYLAKKCLGKVCLDTTCYSSIMNFISTTTHLGNNDNWMCFLKITLISTLETNGRETYQDARGERKRERNTSSSVCKINWDYQVDTEHLCFPHWRTLSSSHYVQRLDRNKTLSSVSPKGEFLRATVVWDTLSQVLGIFPFLLTWEGKHVEAELCMGN